MSNTNLCERRSISASERSRLLHRDGYKCRICNEDFMLLYPGRYVFDLDHMRALRNNGTNDSSLLQCLCLRCHRVKTTFDNNTALWERVTGVSKYFSGPLAMTTSHLFAYYHELGVLVSRRVDNEKTPPEQV